MTPEQPVALRQKNIGSEPYGLLSISFRVPDRRNQVPIVVVLGEAMAQLEARSLYKKRSHGK